MISYTDQKSKAKKVHSCRQVTIFYSQNYKAAQEYLDYRSVLVLGFSFGVLVLALIQDEVGEASYPFPK